MINSIKFGRIDGLTQVSLQLLLNACFHATTGSVLNGKNGLN